MDVATGWSERVGGAVHRVRQRLPFPLLGLNSDNGSEFINQHLYAYCQRLLDSGILTQARRQELAATYHGLNPILLLEQISENLQSLWKLAEHPAYQQRKVKTQEVSVTVYFDAIQSV